MFERLTGAPGQWEANFQGVVPFVSLGLIQCVPAYNLRQMQVGTVSFTIERLKQTHGRTRRLFKIISQI
jgi:hypothetical protein